MLLKKCKKQGGWVFTISVLLVLVIALAVLYIITNNKDKKQEPLKPTPSSLKNPHLKAPIDLDAEPPVVPQTIPQESEPEADTLFVPDPVPDEIPKPQPTLVNGLKKPQSLIDLLILGAVAQNGVTNSYNGAYQKLSYPNGDVDISTGVCTDVVIRAFRSIHIDLQKEIHMDMSRHFRKYPRKWGLKSTDRNIDHRRVPNMETYFTRKGYKVPIGSNTDIKHYLPGDLVVWRINDNLTHIGIVTDEIVPNTSRYFIIHNPVKGVEISDWLDGEIEIINHFRFFDGTQSSK